MYLATFSHDAIPHVRALKADSDGKPLWLWGGGDLFRQLAEVGLVDTVEVAIIPILLGGHSLVGPGLRLALRRSVVTATGSERAWT